MRQVRAQPLHFPTHEGEGNMRRSTDPLTYRPSPKGKGNEEPKTEGWEEHPSFRFRETGTLRRLLDFEAENGE